MQWILLMFFGAIGVVTRYSIDLVIAEKIASGFPLHTFLINLGGSFLMGIIFVFGKQNGLLSSEMTVALTVGFLGGFTTFSSYSIQTLNLLERKDFFTAGIYFLSTPTLSVLFAFLGTLAAKSVLT